MFFVWDWQHSHLLLLCTADLSLVTVGSSTVLAGYFLEVHFVLVLGIQHAAVVLGDGEVRLRLLHMLGWLATDAAFMALSDMPSTFMDEQLLLLPMGRWWHSHHCLILNWNSTSHVTRNHAQSREVSTFGHPWGISITMVAHRWVVAKLWRWRLLLKVRVIHPSARKDLMMFMQPHITHLLVDIGPMHLLEVIASILDLIAKEACNMTTHVKERILIKHWGTLVGNAVIHIVVGRDLARVASVELCLEICADLWKVSLIVRGMPWSAMQIFIASFGASRHQMLASTSLSNY
jgi:hypothetical protein